METYPYRYSFRLCSLIICSILLCLVSCSSVRVPISSTPVPLLPQSFVPMYTLTAIPAYTSSTVPARTEETSSANKPDLDVIIDTDMAVDDWMAILYLLHHPDIHIRAITVTGAGEAHCNAGVENALGLITLAQHVPIPVACGPEAPLQGNHTFPQGWRDFVDGLANQTLSASVNPGAGIDAIQLLTQTTLSSTEKITLLTLGPLTNVAYALQSTPELAGNIAGIFVMGGAVRVPGNLEGNVPGNPSAEWNIYIDPHAANVVFASGVPVTLVRLDVTNQTPLTMEFLQELEKNQITNTSKFIYSVMNQMQDSIRSGTYYFWDPLSAAILVDNSVATYQKYPICVVETEGSKSGRTEEKAGCPVIHVAVSADAGRFEKGFLDTLNAQPDLQTVDLSSLKGTWSGTSHNGNLAFQVTVTFAGSCNTGIPCGTFDIATLPCSGEYVFIGMTRPNQYEFAEINKQGVCGFGQDFFELQGDGSLFFKSLGDYGVDSGYLQKTSK